MFHRLSRYSASKNVLIIVENNSKDAVFDPIITTSVSCDVYWECSNGYREKTTGTSHVLSYTAPYSSIRKWVIRCSLSLSVISSIDCSNDSVSFVNVSRASNMTSFAAWSNSITGRVRDFGQSLQSLDLAGAGVGVFGRIADISSSINSLLSISGCTIYGDLSELRGLPTTFKIDSNTFITGSLASLKSNMLTVWLHLCTGVCAASISHVVSSRDIRIYSMGWLVAATGIDVVINSVYSARASYTYASGIVLRYGGTDAIPSGTEGTTPPANGVTNSDWEWDAVNEVHIPLTPQAKMFICQNDPYAEGFNRWTFTKV